jgi:hypothetical protein
MKLYEFTFNDNTNLSENEVLAVVQKDLEEEAALKGWAPGYNFRQCQSPKQLADGEKEYFFVVEGDVLSETQDGSEEESAQKRALPKRDVAASP